MFRKAIGILAFAYFCNFCYYGVKGITNWGIASDRLSEVAALESKVVREIHEFDVRDQYEPSINQMETDSSNRNDALRARRLKEEADYNVCLELQNFRKAIALFDYKKVDCEEFNKFK